MDWEAAATIVALRGLHGEAAADQVAVSELGRGAQFAQQVGDGGDDAVDAGFLAEVELGEHCHGVLLHGRLAHATVSITLDIYGHGMPTDDSEAAAKVAGLIFGA